MLVMCTVVTTVSAGDFAHLCVEVKQVLWSPVRVCVCVSVCLQNNSHNIDVVDQTWVNVTLYMWLNFSLDPTPDGSRITFSLALPLCDKAYYDISWNLSCSDWWIWCSYGTQVYVYLAEFNTRVIPKINYKKTSCC